MIGRTLNLGNPVNRNAALNRGLVLLWLALQQPYYGGLRFLDLCGANHGALTNGPTWHGARGRPGGWGCIRGDATDDCVIGSLASTQTSDFSFSCWFLDISFGLGYTNNIFTFNGAFGSNGWGFNRVSDGALNVIADGASFTALTTNGSYSANTWTHAMFTRTAGGSNTLYVNGVSAATGTQAFNTPTAGGSYLLSQAGNRASDVFVDDYRVFNYCKSASEVWGIYADSRQGYPTTLNWSRPMVGLDQGGAAAFIDNSNPIWRHILAGVL